MLQVLLKRVVNHRWPSWLPGVASAVTLFVVTNALAQTAPTIIVQPQNETVLAGRNVVLTVGVADGAASPPLPSVSSGTLRLWLRGDQGAVTNASGQVSQWQDQSGNANNASQSSSINQPSLVYPAEIGGRAAIRFNGIQDGVNGDYLHGTGDVGIPGAMTSFALYNAITATNVNVIWLVGVPGLVYGASRCDAVFNGVLDFSQWAYQEALPFEIPTNTYRIWSDRVDAALSTLQVLDFSSTTATNFSVPMGGAVNPSPGYYLGGIDPSLTYVTPDDFHGDLAELIIYNGYLSDSDRLAVLGYLQEKYYQFGNTNGLSFQWQFNGTNIAGATNATLTLADVQPSEAGDYSVLVTNFDGSATSSNAVLTVNTPPPCAPIPAGLVAWWTAEGNANDIVGGNNGSLSNGASFGPGEVGEAFMLNGANQYVAIPDAPALRPASLTVEGWYNLQADGGVRVLVAKPYGPGTWDSFAVWVLNGELQAGVVTANTEQPTLTYNWSPAFSAWHHVAYSFDATAALQSFYVDGVAVASNSASGPIAYDNHPFQIGADIENGSPAFFFDGSIDEVSLYNRALNANEIAAIYAAGSQGKCGAAGTIIGQPQSENVAVGATAIFSVTAAGSPPFGYQWSFDGTNISGGTDSSLVLANIAASMAGSYSVTVSNSVVSVASSNAILTVGYPPTISLFPLSQTVAQGTNVSFTATATGTGPLNFQWDLNGSALTQATNSSLALTDVQSSNAGSYTVTVSSPFGTAGSSNAVLTVDLLPVVGGQPQSQSVVVGSNVSFSVATGSSLPPVNSGTLQLWLRADTGVVTNASGFVSRWQDQSGNTNDAVQSATNYQPSLVYPPSIGWNASVRFNGSQSSINYLQGSGNVGVPDAMTTFTIVDTFTATNYVPMAWLIGIPPNFGAVRSETDYQGLRTFTTWGNGYDSPFEVPLNTYRIWGDRMDSNLTTLELFDTSATGSTNFTSAMPSATTPGAGYYVGGIDPTLPQVAGWKLNGDIAEWIVYKGKLTDADRLAVLGYLQQKYFQTGSTAGDTYQWDFDGTNIAGATNATLTLTNVQAANAGTYTVTVTDAAGSTTSSNAVLTTLFPAAITSSPTNQSVSAGTTVTFTAAATGTAPLNLQWQFDGTNIAGATNTSLTVNSAVEANAGSYMMVASNPYGIATSSPATLSVDESTVQVVSTSATGGGTVVVSVDLIALGTESGVGFSLNFDPSVLTYTGSTLGSGAAGGASQVNTNQAASGRLGFGVAQFNGTFSAGTNDIFDVTFQIAVVTNAVTTSVGFGSQPTGEQVSDPTAQALPAVYLSGVVVISPTELEGDVSPQPGGNEVLDITDWIQEGRYVAGLDTITNADDFERADCAPRSTLGDGQITVADWVQVGRYAVGLDPLTAAGGPSSPQPNSRNSVHPIKDGGSSALTLVPLSQGSQVNSVAVELASQGTVNSAGFSVTFNPALVRFVGASLGSGATGAAFIQNTNQAANGTVGFVVGSLSPATFAAGTAPLVNLNFVPVAYSNTTALAFSDSPVACQLVDTNAEVVTATFVNAALAVGGSTWPALSITPAGDNVVLSWPSSATGFALQAASSLGGTWSDISGTLTTNGGSVTLTAPVPNSTVYYRLKY